MNNIIIEDEETKRQTCLLKNSMMILSRSNINIYTPNNYTIPNNVKLTYIDDSLKFRHYDEKEHPDANFKKGIWVLIRTYEPRNAGHVLGDEVFAIWQTLIMFNLQDKCDQLNIITDNRGRHLKQYECITKNKVYDFRDFSKPTFFETLICGTDRQRYALIEKRPSYLPKYNITLESFKNQAYKSFNIIPEKKRSILFLDKCAEISEHKCKLYDIDKLVDHVSRKYMDYNVKKISWKNMDMRNQVKEMESAEIVVTLPGSDMMNCVFLNQRKNIICVCRFMENGNKEYSNEVGLWFAHTNHNIIYIDDVEKIISGKQLFSKIRDCNILYNHIDTIISNINLE